MSLLMANAGLAEEPHVAPVRDYFISSVQPWLSDPVIVQAVIAQNGMNAALDQAAIAALDQKWRAEIEAENHPMVDEVLANRLSTFLRSKQDESGGTITEVFVTDAKGLNVGQSDVTSDYWQGDEEKFTKTFGAGPGAIFVDVAEKDESTQMLQSQVSMTIVDEDGKPIGTITVGVNLDQL
ncbi:hypothetical protein [Rhizobium sp.]